MSSAALDPSTCQKEDPLVPDGLLRPPSPTRSRWTARRSTRAPPFGASFRKQKKLKTTKPGSQGVYPSLHGVYEAVEEVEDVDEEVSVPPCLCLRTQNLTQSSLSSNRVSTDFLGLRETTNPRHSSWGRGGPDPGTAVRGLLRPPEPNMTLGNL